MIEKVTLVERNVNCANITKDEFVQAIKEIVTEAIKTWYNYQLSQCEEYNKQYIADQQARIIDFANKKYKRPSYKNAYIEKAISEIDTNKSKPYQLGSVLFDVEPDQLGTSSDCYINMDNPDRIEKCYEYVKDKPYFKKITGWKIIRYCGCSSFEFETDAETKADMDKRVKTLTDTMTNYYSDINRYYGD